MFFILTERLQNLNDESSDEPNSLDLKLYYGPFFRTPEKFEILRGHKKLLLQAIELIKDKKAKFGLKYFNMTTLMPSIEKASKHGSKKVNHNNTKIVHRSDQRSVEQTIDEDMGENLRNNCDGEMSVAVTETSTDPENEKTLKTKAININHEQSVVFKQIKDMIKRKTKSLFEQVK